MKLSGKTALVTGGGTGIGSGIAKAFASEGCQVVITGRREEKLKEALKEFPAGASVAHRAVDVSHRDEVNALFDWFYETYGQIDILVNSAGTNIKTRTMSAMSPEQWDEVLRINATGAYNTMYRALPNMRERKDGLVINISSIAGKRASSLGGIAYSASKFAMTALGTAVGNEEAANGIRVTNIYPGEVNTPILENRPAPVSDERKATMLQADDIAQLALTIACLHPRAHVAELVIKPLVQEYV